MFDAGLVDLVKSDQQVGSGGWFEPTPGHSHVSVRISSKGEEAIITGDMTRHPCQIARPDRGTPCDNDTPAEVKTRQAFIALRGRTHHHLRHAFRKAGGSKIVKDGGSYRLAV